MRALRVWSTVVIVSCILSACSSHQAQLVGSWRAKPVESKSSPNLGDVAGSAMLGLFTQGMAIEFNKEGKFKISQFIGAGTGSYRIEGDKIKMKLDTLSPNSEFTLKFGADGKTIELDRQFPSDPVVVFEKQPSR